MLDELFADKIERVPLCGCWIWTGTLNGDGYAISHRGEGSTMVHRKMLIARLGRPLHEGMMTDHLCRVRCCVNPEHLEEVTSAENTFRGIGLAKVNVDKTHCPKGHLYDVIAERSYGTFRRCSVCQREANRKYNLKRPDRPRKAKDGRKRIYRKRVKSSGVAHG